MKEFLLIMPEIFLALTLAAVVASEVTYHGEKVRFVSPIAMIGLSTAFIQALLLYQYPATAIFHQTLSMDGLSLFFKLLFLALGALSIATGAGKGGEIPPSRRAEFVALVVAATLSSCLAAASSDLIVAFLSLQLTNGASYYLASFGKKELKSTEAGVKYLIFSALAAALFLYGTALLFAYTKSVNIYEIHASMMSSALGRPEQLVILLLLLGALSFQVAAFPMQFWAPDVIEGAPTPAAGFLSISGRAAGFAVALRLLIGAFARPSATLGAGQWEAIGPVDWPLIVALLSGVSMLFGSLLALRQESAKRMVGALVIAESGHMLLGVLVLDQVGLAAVLFSWVTQLFSLLGIFTVLSFVHDEIGSDKLSDLKKIMPRAVPESIALVLFMFCLVGLPPTPGFLAKFTLIGVAVRHHWMGLAIVAIFSSAVSAISVARLTQALVVGYRTSSSTSGTSGEVMKKTVHSRYRVLLSILVVPMLLIGFFAEGVLGWAGQSLGFIFW